MPHDGHTDEMSHLSDVELRVRALESVLTEKGYLDPAALDIMIETYETKVGPRNGARVVAKAWSDPAFREALMSDATAAISSLGFTGRQGEHMVALENTDVVHNMVVCTLCSCYPRPILGIPPAWYKRRDYRARAVREPRAVLKEFGTEITDSRQVRVHDSNADLRYLVLPKRPEGTEGWDAEQLEALITRDSMIGVSDVRDPADVEA